MDEMQMIDRDKIESSAPYAIAWASSVPGDAQGTLHHYLYNLLIPLITVVDKAYLGHYTYATIVYKWRLV